MGMLHCCDKPDIPRNKVRYRESENVCIKVHPVRVIHNTRGIIQRRVAEVDNQFHHFQKPCRQVTGTITGITTDNNKKPGIA